MIQLIEALPPDERRQVVDFIKRLETPSPERTIRYAEVKEVEAIAERIFEEHAESFRKLAQ